MCLDCVQCFIALERRTYLVLARPGFPGVQRRIRWRWCVLVVPSREGRGEILPGKVLEKVIIMICPDVWENCVMKNKLLNGLGQSSM